ncbi:MAG: hypothetical protein WCY19_08475 [Candidatus Gastranaerophilaceae bacterium]
MYKTVFHELKEHAPFTFLGALSGILIFIFLRNIPSGMTFKLFYTFHPLHVLLSAFVTTSMYKLHKKNPNMIKVFLVGFIGSVGVATLSDSILPFIGETILHLPHRELHLGFIEKWYIINPIAILGILLASAKPSTKFPHSGHILVSTWASLFHIMMSLSGMIISIPLYFAIVFLLFLSVWLPCCFSDIVFPLLFVKGHDTDCPCHNCEHTHD